jgi:hypothetical protein
MTSFKIFERIETGNYNMDSFSLDYNKFINSLLNPIVIQQWNPRLIEREEIEVIDKFIIDDNVVKIY